MRKGIIWLIVFLVVAAVLWIFVPAIITAFVGGHP